MSSLLGDLLRPTNAAPPVPYVPRQHSVFGSLAQGVSGGDRTAQLGSMGGVGTLFAIVDGNAEATSMITWHLWRKAASGRPEDRTEVTDHAALTVWNQPNAFMTGQELREATQQHFELVGERIWLVVYAGTGRNRFPVEMWYVRPDRIRPVPHRTRYLVGWVYTGPDGEEVPLAVDEVLFDRRPHPQDMYRGQGAVQSILADLDATKYSADWNRNFFLNGARPGGVIEIPGSLSDVEWQVMNRRWREQHQGVRNAHRVAMIEHGGKWVDVRFSMRDMMYPELRNASRETIREAFRYPKPMLGAVDDINRANAEAGEYVYGKWHLVPRLERLKQLANVGFLPLFGASTAGLELDYDIDQAVPSNAELENATQESRARVVTTLAPYFDMQTLAEAYELPRTLRPKTVEERAAEAAALTPKPSPAETDGDDEIEQGREESATSNVDAGLSLLRMRAEMRRRRPDLPDSGNAPAPVVNEAPAAPDLSQLDAAWTAALDELLEQWTDVSAEQRAELIEQVEIAVAAGTLAALAALTVTATGAAVLETALLGMSAAAAAAMVAEATAAGLSVAVGMASRDAITALAETTAALLATDLAQSAGREALRLARPGMSREQAQQVAQDVGQHLADLSDARLRTGLGGALSRAANMGRIATASAVVGVRYYASEILDTSTCKPCREADGVELPTIDAVITAYGGGGYIHCLGTVRCRGTFVIRPAETGEGGQ